MVTRFTVGPLIMLDWLRVELALYSNTGEGKVPIKGEEETGRIRRSMMIA